MQPEPHIQTGAHAQRPSRVNEQSPDRVTIVITCYNQASYLEEAIESARGQTHRNVEIAVVDDGSTDETPQVAAAYPDVAYLHQPNNGLGEARNTGLRAATGSHVIFLDADDRLRPDAVANGLACFEDYPDAPCVFGSHRRIADDGSPLEIVRYDGDDVVSYDLLLRGNVVGMHAAVMYRRDALLHAGGFDTSLPACEDYELYLRIARDAPLRAHRQSVADYRIHKTNMSRDAKLMLTSVTSVLEAQRPITSSDRVLRRARKYGLKNWRAYYGRLVKKDAFSRRGTRVGSMLFLLRRAPGFLARSMVRTIAATLLRQIRRVASGLDGFLKIPSPEPGGIDLGDLGRVEPVSRSFGYDRGRPVDRYYIEDFLKRQSNHIKGRVLEIGDDSYTRRFGGAEVTRSDVLHVDEGHPHATLTGDLTDADHIPSQCFDGIIVTQTLQFVYDLTACISTLHRMLKPGGVVLATAPGISPIPRDQWGDRCCWSFTPLSMRRLFGEAFGPDNVAVESPGNVLASIAFLHGLAAEELRPDELDVEDASYPLVICVMARKQDA